MSYLMNEDRDEYLVDTLNVNPELMANEITHFDTVKRLYVKLFNSTKTHKSVTAEIMKGKSIGKWVRCSLSDLVTI